MNRFRRLRNSKAIRELLRETVLTPRDFIQPFFVVGGKGKKEKIDSMPGVFRYSTDVLLKSVEAYIKAGGLAGLFFGIPSKKDKEGSEAYAASGVIQKAVKAIKKEFPEFYVITDVCMCSYTDHGHCGIVTRGRVDNDKTLTVLGKVAVSHATAGADMVAPSDMMDFRVRHIRQALDENQFTDTALMSYAVKYSSAFYGPFREAADSAPGFGDRKSYQMDPANKREALKEALRDIEEGADIVMVKPAVAYLDIISLIRENTNTPVAAYHVSGEYSMIKAAAGKGWINEADVALETLIGIKRAGADLIITYFAEDVLKWL